MSQKINLLQIEAEQALSVLDNDFKTEKELCDHIEETIEEVVFECFGMHYKGHKREFKVFPHKLKINGSHTHIDFMIETKCGKSILIECKNLKDANSSYSGIGQILTYGALFNQFRHRPHLLVLITTKMDANIKRTIETFNLPIVYISMDKSRFVYSCIKHLKTVGETEDGKV